MDQIWRGNNDFQKDARELHFPEEAAVGRLFVRSADSQEEADWRLNGVAQGVVTFPPFVQVRLVLGYWNEFHSTLHPDLRNSFPGVDASELDSLKPFDHALAWQSLHKLPPDGIDSLVLDNIEHVCDDEMASVGHLRGLKHFESCFLKDKDLVHLKDLVGLRCLNIGSEGIEDGSLEYLSRMNQLEELDLTCARVHGCGLRHIQGEKIKRLVLRSTRICDDLTPHILHFQGLEDLDLSNTQVSDDLIAGLALLPNLKSLHLGETRITDYGVAKLTELPKLMHLELDQTQVSDMGVKLLESSTPLKKLSLSGTAVSSAAVRSLLSVGNLEEIDLSDTATDDYSFAGTENLGELDSINLSRTQVTDTTVLKLSTAVRLRSLSLDGAVNVTDGSLSQFGNLSSLQSLYLDKTRITNECLRFLAGLPELRLLSLRDTEVNDAGLQYLSAMHNLEFLDLTNTGVSEAGIANLAKISKLQSLWLLGTSITHDSLLGLESLTSLTALVLPDFSTSMTAVLRLQNRLPCCAIMFGL